MNRALLIVLVLGLVSISASASAQLKPGSILITGNLGAMLVKSDVPDLVPTNYTGWGLNVNVEKVLNNPHLAIGFGIGFIKADQSFTQGSEFKVSTNYEATPIVLSLKYYFGSKPVMGYVGLGVTSNFGTLEATFESSEPNSDLFRRWVDTSIGVAVPLGVLVHVSDNTYVNLGYTPYWTNSEITNQIKHMFMAGLTVSFGD